MSLLPSLSREEIIRDTRKKYKDRTGKDLVDDSLATEIKSCDSPTAVCHVFRQHAQALGDDSTLMKCLEVIVDGLQALSKVAGLQDVYLSDYIVYVTILKCSVL